jgi:hypothetical protein
LTHLGRCNNTKNISKFQYNFQFWFYLIFIWKMIQIIDSFHTIAPNYLKSSRCTPTHYQYKALCEMILLLIESFSKIPKAQCEASWYTNLHEMIVLLIERFSKIPRAWCEALWFGRSQCDKQNKLPCLINRVLICTQ